MTTPLLHARPAAVSERARTHNLLLLPDPQGSLPTLAPDRDPLQRLHHVLLLPGSQGEVTINGGNSSVGSPAAALLQQPFHVTHQQRGGKRGEQPLGPPCRRVFFESDCHPPRESVSSVLRTKKEKKYSWLTYEETRQWVASGRYLGMAKKFGGGVTGTLFFIGEMVTLVGHL